MFSSPKRKEIDHRTIKLLVGLIAISLASVTSYFSETPLQSISAAYHEGRWPRDIFVGFLYAIAAFLFAYNGYSKPEMIWSKVGAFAALGIAMFPCGCDHRAEIIQGVHAVSAAIMFLVLTVFCWEFFRRARDKKETKANWRSYIYAACGIVLLVSNVVLAIDGLSHGVLSSKMDRLVFYGEFAGLFAFGISWLTASRVLPFITSKSERFSPFNGGATEP